MQDEQEHIDPPKLADRFFNWYCYQPLRETISGDLYERYMDNIDRFGLKKANRKYWFDVLRFMNRHTLKRSKKSNSYNANQIAMLSNYFKVGFRNLLKNKTYSLINIFGLSISMAVCLIIILMINDQYSYDDFQTNRDRIYRVTSRNTKTNELPSATAPLPFADRLQADFPGIEHLVRISSYFRGELMQNGKAIQLSGLFTEPSFFDVFSFELAKGDKKTCLANPNSVVLRKDIAEKLFREKDPIGQSIEVGKLGSFMVTGVLKEFPGKTHIDFEALASYSSIPALKKRGLPGYSTNNWNNNWAGWLYFTLFEETEAASLQPVLTKAVEENYDKEAEFVPEFGIQKMTKITPGPLYSNQIGSFMPNFFSYGLGILAFLIIVCATFNYTNLSAARALTRAKEVGVRKVMGAKKLQLTQQFIIESILVSLCSLIVAIVLLQFMIPAFARLELSKLLNWQLEPTTQTYLQFLLFSILVGLITGIFPSLYMSSFRPIEAMKNIIGTSKLSKVGLRKALIVSQFVISLVLIVSSVLVYKQLKFMIEKDYGYTKESIVNIDLQGQSFDILKSELQKLTSVELISGVSHIPNTGNIHEAEVRKNLMDEPVKFNRFFVDDSYIETLNLTLVAGNNFLPSQKDGSTIIVNETAVKDLGYESAHDIIDQFVVMKDDTKARVIGVLKDYHFAVLYMDIMPLYLSHKPERFKWVQVKLSGIDNSKEIEQLANVWTEFDPNHDFEYKTFQGQVDEFHAYFYDILYIIGLVAALSISIAGMGLWGIATYSIKIRLKEVGIRRVLGASVRGLTVLLSKGFLVLFTVSMTIGFTIAYMGNSLWLNEFAYRITFGINTFLISALAMLFIGVMTIGVQAFNASTTNPVQVLRDD